MPSRWSRRNILAAGSIGTLTALAGCNSLPFVSSEAPLTIRVSNEAEREYRIGVIALKDTDTQYTDAKVIDDEYMVQPTDGFRTLTEIENRRYHVRTQLSGMGYFSEQFEYQYYPSCGTNDELNPTLSMVIHPPADQGHPFVAFSQAECQPG